MNHFHLRISQALTAKVIISVSKKLFRKAVMRNKIRRRVRAVIRNVHDLKPGIYFISAKAGAENVKGEELKFELAKLIRSIRN